MATEKRLIDANITINAFTNWLTSRYDGRLPRDIVAEIPTVDAVEVVHGRWRFCGSDRYNDAYECSVCGKMAMDDSNYCPNCGAFMDGGFNNG